MKQARRCINMKQILVTAHSGCLGTEDNTVESFLAGVVAGADIVEVDVRFTRDGVPVLSHDAVSPDAEASLVRVSEILRLMKEYPQIKVNFDIKETQGLRQLGEMISEYQVGSQAFFTGIGPDAADLVRTECPDVDFLLNVKPDPPRANEPEYLSSLVDEVIACGALGLNVYHRLVTEELVQAVHDADRAVYVWTANDEESMKRMIEFGVDSITSRAVDVLIKMLQDLGMRA
jgi:glycerophosphoryl diester phosphodiesterase